LNNLFQTDTESPTITPTTVIMIMSVSADPNVGSDKKIPKAVNSNAKAEMAPKALSSKIESRMLDITLTEN